MAAQAIGADYVAPYLGRMADTIGAEEVTAYGKSAAQHSTVWLLCCACLLTCCASHLAMLLEMLVVVL